MKVEYRSNNSGGNWWLTDENWLALEKAGWKVAWVGNGDAHSGDRWLGALARSAIKEGATSLEKAAEEWEQITGERATDAGCPCCGIPHTFTLYGDEGEYISSGPDASYECNW